MAITPVIPWSESAAFPVLTMLMLIPLATLAAVLLSRSSAVALRIGFAGTLSTVLLSFYLLSVFDADRPGIQLAEEIHKLDFTYSVGVDGANILFIPLTAIFSLLALVYTSITRHATDRLKIACLLGYEGILIGAFSAMNLMQFWLWCALELIPVVLLTIRAGTGQNRHWVVALLLQHWLGGLLMTLAGFMLLAFGLMGAVPGAELTFDWLKLKEVSNAQLQYESLIFFLLFFGFAIRMPIFPFHGWLPVLAEQGTVASVAIFLVGLKLGVYAAIRFILPLIPEAAEQWSGFVLTLGLISIIYGALLALMQINIRRLLAFAVVSHTGMLVIGIFDLNEYGMEGTILLAVSYGLATAGMFFSVGLIYKWTRTAIIPRLGGLFDANITITFLFAISALTTMAMPGTPGFDGAHLLIEGAATRYGWLVVAAILLGNLLAAGLLLRAFQQMFIAAPKRFLQPHSSAQQPARKEQIIAVVICALLIGTGFYTTPWVNVIDQNVMASMHELDAVLDSSHQSTKQPSTTTVPIGAKGGQNE
jgi:NADH-quinone oxidoreductase subunit M